MAVRKALPYLDQTTASIPGTKEFVISLVGDDKRVTHINVFDPASGLLATDAQGNYALSIYGRNMLVSPQWLVLFAFSPLYKAQSFFDKFEVVILDKSQPIDLHPRNLAWVIPAGGVEDPERPGFYIPPYYSGACVSRKGEVWTRRMNRFCTVRKAGNGKGNTYLNTSLTSNSGNVDTVGLHRVIAMAFLRLEGNPYEMTVNHEDGKKSMNLDENLAWATYQENNIHAKDNGLCDVRKAVYVRDYDNNLITRFNSVSAAGLQLGVNDGAISALINYGGIHKERYEFISVFDLENNIRGWNEGAFKSRGYDVSNPKLATHTVFTRRIVVYNVKDETADVYNDQYLVAKALKMAPARVLKALQRTRKFVEHGVLICYRDESAALIKAIKEGSRSLVKPAAHVLPGKTTLKVELDNKAGQNELIQVVENVQAYLGLFMSKRQAKKVYKDLDETGVAEIKGRRFTIV